MKLLKYLTFIIVGIVFILTIIATFKTLIFIAFSDFSLAGRVVRYGVMGVCMLILASLIFEGYMVLKKEKIKVSKEKYKLLNNIGWVLAFISIVCVLLLGLSILGVFPK